MGTKDSALTYENGINLVENIRKNKEKEIKNPKQYDYMMDVIEENLLRFPIPKKQMISDEKKDAAKKRFQILNKK